MRAGIGAGRRFDVRIPANSEDFETTVSRTATAPQEFEVTSDGTTNSFEITDQVAGRSATKTYRIYFLDTNGRSVDLSTVEKKKAALRMARLVTEVASTGTGDKIPYTDSRNVGKTGYYFCVAVNERGQEAPLEHVAEAPV